LVGIVTKFNLNKSEYDSGFRPWGETLGCVQSPPMKKLRLNKV